MCCVWCASAPWQWAQLAEALALAGLTPCGQVSQWSCLRCACAKAHLHGTGCSAPLSRVTAIRPQDADSQSKLYGSDCLWPPFCAHSTLCFRDYLQMLPCTAQCCDAQYSAVMHAQLCIASVREFASLHMPAMINMVLLQMQLQCKTALTWDRWWHTSQVLQTVKSASMLAPVPDCGLKDNSAITLDRKQLVGHLDHAVCQSCCH